MKFFLSSKEFQPLGSVEIDADPSRTRLGQITRRNQRVATLDGGVAVSDFGFSEGDRNVQIVFATDDFEKSLRVGEIVKQNSALILTYNEGAYEAVVRYFVYDPNGSTLSMDITAKIS